VAARIRLGMVGGGQGAFIGAVHRIAARIDDHYELVAGALSSDPARAKASADELGLARSYSDYEQMAREEAARDDGIQAVAIVTPNHLHAPIAMAFLQAGIHVICDKPLTASMEHAKSLTQAVEDSGKQFILTHNYTGTPMIRQARDMVANGELGQIRLICSEYLQDWLTETPEADNKQAAWRTDPKLAGAGALGDIGTHAYNLANFVSGMTPDSLCAEVSTFVPGRLVDDNAQVTLRYSNGARGTLWASQVAVGNENGLTLRIYGDKGGIEWHQEHPNHLWFTPFGQPKQLLTRSGNGATDLANRVSRTPGGHPEGYLEAFATIYSEAAAAIRSADGGAALEPGHHTHDANDGLQGMKFISACLRSSEEGGVWVNI